jgi:hypothetical protein
MIAAEVDGTPGANDMPGRLVFSTTADGAASLTERMRIDSSGRVGIGTTSPGAQLHSSANVSDSTVHELLRLGGTHSGASGGGWKLTFNQTGDGSPEKAFLRTIYTGAWQTDLYTTSAGPLTFGTNSTERARIDSSGRLLVGTSTASGAATLQVQTPTTLSTTADTGVALVNTLTKTYPTTANYIVTAGLGQSVELGTAQTVDTVTPGGNNFVYGLRNILTKSAGNVQDIERLYFVGFNQLFTWADANTCKQYIGITDTFNYQGINANGRTSTTFNAQNLRLAVPNGGTQTITNTTGPNGTSLEVSNATGTINITNAVGVTPFLTFRALTSGTLTANITNYTFLGTNTAWGAGVSGTGVNVATITNLYGLRLTAPTPSTGLTVTNNWGIRQEWSSAKNWFAGASNQFPNITTTASGANAFLDSADSNRLYLSTSSLAYKRDVEDLDSSIADQILNLRPVWYRSKCETDCADWSWYGLIAEEVAEIDPRFVHYGYQEDAYELIETTETAELSPDDPRREEGIDTEEITRQERQLKADAQQVPNGVAYERLVVPLLDIIKRQKSQLDSFEARLAALEA